MLRRQSSLPGRRASAGTAVRLTWTCVPFWRTGTAARGGRGCSGRRTVPWMVLLLDPKAAPWHGHTNCRSVAFQPTSQPWWVHLALTAVNVLAPVRVM